MVKDVIAVDLDGTLIERSILQLIMEEDLKTSNSFNAFQAILFYGLQKTNPVTREYIRENLDLLKMHDISNTKLKVNQILIEYLKRSQENNILILATGSDQYVAYTMCCFFWQNLGLIFDYAIGSTDGNIYVAERKLEEIKKIAKSFTYIGNSYQDLSIWEDKSIKMICIGSPEFWKLASEVSQKTDSINLPNIFVSPGEINQSGSRN